MQAIKSFISTSRLSNLEADLSGLTACAKMPDSSRSEIADKISKTVRTVQRALDSLRDKGYIQRVGSKQEPYWEVLK